MPHDFPQPVDAAEVPRFAGIPSFMRLPIFEDPAQVDIALVGVPWDGGTTNRAGARHGPREVRNQSSLMRKVHHVSRIAPYDLARVADLGDVALPPMDLMLGLDLIEAFYRREILLLQERRYREWLQLMDDRIEYRVPVTTSTNEGLIVADGAIAPGQVREPGL